MDSSNKTINCLRILKNIFLKFRIHHLFLPFRNLFLYSGYITLLSKWIEEHPAKEFNDFYTSRLDYQKRYGLYNFIFEKEALSSPIDYIEFGVASGASMEWWLKHNTHTNSKFYGFDTFTGLPEDWGLSKKGMFSSNGQVPQVNDGRCRFIKGLFSDTLGQFLKTTPLENSRKVIHLDADLYSSTLYALTSMSGYLKEGDILIFDEFNLPLDEFRAFIDFTHSYKRSYTLLGAVNNYFAVALKLTN